ncbi:hypothetical protein [Candidatus Accumulibacter sp. ACC003]|nr:hypothetical protein [Candidatus Accumulibacter sp. ACC003]
MMDGKYEAAVEWQMRRRLKPVLLADEFIQLSSAVLTVLPWHQ